MIAYIVNISHICLKQKQVICLEYIFLGKDVLAILPTGYGKSLVFHLLPPLLTHKYKQQTSTKESLQGTNKEMLRKIIIVLSPLDSMINDQISRLASSGLQSSMLSVSWKYIGDVLNVIYDLVIKQNLKVHYTTLYLPGVENIADHGTIGPRKFFMLAERKKGRKKKGERKKRRKRKERKKKERKRIERKNNCTNK